MKKFLISFLILGIVICKSFAVENKIILKIDNDIITTFDLIDEINSLKFFNKNFINIKDEEIYQIALQSLLKYKIKENEILKNIENIELQDEQYLNSLIKRDYEKLNFNKIDDFKKELSFQNIDFNNYLKKKKIEILWNQIIYTKHYDKLIINEEVLKEQLSKDKVANNLYKLNEIIFQIDQIDELEEKYNLIKNDIENLGFEVAALKHSVSKSANEGGNLGWIDEKTIKKDILDILKQQTLGSISKPIRISGGFLILKKDNVKTIENNLNYNDELQKLIIYEKDKQLDSYSNLYFNKVKKRISINAP